MGRAPQVCTVHGCPEIAVRIGRCPTHAREHDQVQRMSVPTKVAGRSHGERQRRRQAVSAWVRRRGWWCPGYGRPPHAVKPGGLTAEHGRALGDDGSVGQVLSVLCRSCNSRHGQQTGMKYRE